MTGTNMIDSVIFLKADDWVGMYINGNLVAEGHSLPDHVVAELIAKKVGFVVDVQWNEDLIDKNGGRCPLEL